jgi:hypothetical protein
MLPTICYAAQCAKVQSVATRVNYQWLPELGNPDRQDPEIRSFQQLMDQEAESRLQRLQTLGQAVHTCLLCAEQDAQRCHRRITRHT